MPVAGDFFGVDVSTARSADAAVSLEGFAQVVNRLLRLPGVAKLALGHAMRAEMEGVISLAQSDYVPVDSGATRDSGKTRGPVFPDSSSIEVWGSFGPVVNDHGSAYTLSLHEIPEPPEKSVGGRSAHHDWGTWKYLQIPFLVRQEGMVDRIQNEFDLLLGRLGIGNAT